MKLILKFLKAVLTWLITFKFIRFTVKEAVKNEYFTDEKLLEQGVVTEEQLKKIKIEIAKDKITEGRRDLKKLMAKPKEGEENEKRICV